MPPAARVTDPTEHGTPLFGQGSPDVRVGGLSAYRAEVDVHLCPMTSSGDPHVGGVVEDGSDTVLINGASAARQGDTITESGPTNEIVGGDPTVLIG